MIASLSLLKKYMKINNHKRSVFFLTLMAAAFLALSEGGFLAYLLSLRKVLRSGSTPVIISTIAIFCLILMLVLYGRYLVDERASIKSTRHGLDRFVRKIEMGVVSPGAMSQIFLSSLSASLPSDIHKASQSRVKALGALVTCLLYGVFLLFLEPLLFLTSSCVACMVLFIKSKVNLDIIYLCNKRLLSIVRMYRDVKDNFADQSSDWFQESYRSSAEQIVSIDHRISRKQFENSLSMIFGRVLDFGICFSLLLYVVNVESIAYFLLVNLTRDIFLRSTGAALDNYVEMVIRGRTPNKMSMELAMEKR